MRRMYFLFFLSFVFFSCTSEHEVINKERVIQENVEMVALLESKYGIKTEFLEDGSYILKYVDGEILKISWQLQLPFIV